MEEMNVQNVVEEATPIIEEAAKSSNGVVGLVLGAVGAVVTGVVVWHKTKPKREAKQVEKLRKKGYTVIEPEDEADVNSEDFVSEEK